MELYPGSGAVIRNLEPEVVTGDGRALEPVMLNFIDTEIDEVVAVVLGELLGVNYTIEPGLRGQVTLQTSQPIPLDSVITTLDVLLNLNGAAIVQAGGLYKIVSLANARQAGVPIRTKPRQDQPGHGYRVQVVPLNYVPVSEISGVLQSLSLGENVLYADATRNVLMLAGSEPELQSLNDAIEIFDVDWLAGMSFGLFPIRFAEAPVITEELEKLFLRSDGDGQKGLVQFMPIERLNSVLVVTRQARYLQRAKTWIERLDRKGDGTSRQIYVYRVQNARAEALASALNEIFRGEDESESRRAPTDGGVAPGLTPALVGAAPLSEGSDLPEPSPITEDRPLNIVDRSFRADEATDGIALLSGSSIRVIADTDQNALIILATPQEYELVEATLKKLDVLPLQVLIQAAIFEVRLTDDLSYGIRWFFERGGHSLEIDNLPAAAGIFSYAFSSTNFAAAVEALSSITDVKTLSSPELMVLDNQTASLQVGDQVPVSTRESQSVTNPEAPIVNSITFRNTGVILRVTPRVNAGGLVTMDIEQEVSNVAASEVATTTPTIFQRTISSTVAVSSGESIALGGLISENQRTSRSGVPVLMDLPLLGPLFRTNSWETERNELLVLITPRVVRNQAEANLVTGELRDRMQQVHGHIRDMEVSGKWRAPDPERLAPSSGLVPESPKSLIPDSATPESLAAEDLRAPEREPIIEIEPDRPPKPVAVEKEKLPDTIPAAKPAEPEAVARLREPPPEPQAKPAEPIRLTPATVPEPVAEEVEPGEPVVQKPEMLEPSLPADREAEPSPLAERVPIDVQIAKAPEMDLPETRLAFYLHLASYRSEKEVDWGWDDLLVSYPDMLEGLGLEKTRVDLGSRGIFYRLSAGPLIDKLRADQICQRLEELNQFCQVRIGPRKGP